MAKISYLHEAERIEAAATRCRTKACQCCRAMPALAELYQEKAAELEEQAATMRGGSPGEEATQ